MPTEPGSILFVITRGDSIGGAQIHVRDVAAGAATRGYRVAVAVGVPGPFLGLLIAAGIPFFLIRGLGRSVNPLADLKAIGAMRVLIRRWKPDLVACHTAKAGLVGRIAAWLVGVPSQYTVHGWQFAEGISAVQRLLVLLTETLLSRITRTIITVSDYDRMLALRFQVAPPRKVVTVHNGMANLPLPPRTSGDGTVRLIMVARFQPQKDHGTLFTALDRLQALPWSLHLVGDGPDMVRWQTWVEGKSWGSRVVFHGLSHDVPGLLSQSDIFILASRWEGFPLSILEAMRAGLPVVASDVGGVAEAVVEGRTGALVPAQDAEALAGALTPLLNDSNLRREWGRRGRERFEAEFTFQAMMDKTEQVWSGA